MMKRVMLVDCMNLLVKFFYASDIGVPQRFKEAVQQAREETSCGEVVLAWDGHRANEYRREIWPVYKSDRPERPAELQEALKRTFELMRNVWPYEVNAAYEADDVIASLIDRNKPNTEYRMLVYSNDSDLHQCLVDGVVSQLLRIDPLTGPEIMTASDLWHKYQVMPREWALYRSLTGDSSDHVSGVPTIGPKNAMAIIRAGDYDGLGLGSDVLRLAIRAGIKGKKLEAIRLAAMDGSLEKLLRVSRLRTDCPVKFVRSNDEVSIVEVVSQEDVQC